jgi:hypothetical protein
VFSPPTDPIPDPAPSDSGTGLTGQVYEQLRTIARARLQSQGSGHTLQATALVHEAFLKLRDHPSILGGDRARFFQSAGQAMRYILIDTARAKRRG